MDRSRRRFLKSAGVGFLALGLPPTFLVRAAAAQQRVETKSWWWFSSAAAWTVSTS
jgi:hypothetical protein